MYGPIEVLLSQVGKPIALFSEKLNDVISMDHVQGVYIMKDHVHLFEGEYLCILVGSIR